MLATLTGTAPFSLTGFGDAEEAWAEPDTAEATADAPDEGDDDVPAEVQDHEEGADETGDEPESVPTDEEETLAHGRS
jgi:hypothetical protein